MREGRCYGLFTSLNALVAQLAEHIHGKDEVNGSIPFEGLASTRRDPGSGSVVSGAGRFAAPSYRR